MHQHLGNSWIILAFKIGLYGRPSPQQWNVLTDCSVIWILENGVLLAFFISWNRENNSLSISPYVHCKTPIALHNGSFVSVRKARHCAIYEPVLLPPSKCHTCNKGFACFCAFPKSRSIISWPKFPPQFIQSKKYGVIFCCGIWNVCVLLLY